MILFKEDDNLESRDIRQKTSTDIRAFIEQQLHPLDKGISGSSL